MRQIVSIYRLLGMVTQTGDSEQKEEARLLTRALKRGEADLSLHVKILEGDIADIKIGNVTYTPFSRKKKGDVNSTVATKK